MTLVRGKRCFDPRLFASLLMLFGYGCAADGEESEIGGVASELAEEATVAIGLTEVDSVPLSDVRSISIAESGRVFVLDAYDPFIRVYDSEGTLLGATAEDGDGPGELRRPWTAVLSGEDYLVKDAPNIVGFSVPGLDEVDRFSTTPSSVALLRACGDRLISVYEGRDPKLVEEGSGSSGDEQKLYGLRSWEGEAWVDISGLAPMASPFTPTYPDFRGATLGDTVVVYDWAESELALISCTGPEAGRVSVPYPEDWTITPKPTGIATVDGEVVLFYSDRPNRTENVTFVARWNPAEEAIQRWSLSGDWRLHGLQDGKLWIVDATLEPIIYGVPSGGFWRWLETT